MVNIGASEQRVEPHGRARPAGAPLPQHLGDQRWGPQFRGARGYWRE